MNRIHRFYYCVLVFGLTILLSSFVRNRTADKISFPYQKAGLTSQQAAAHLLSRFTYGAKEGDVDFVVKMGLENWLQQQLEGSASDGSLKEMLAKFDAINYTNTEVENIFPRRAQVQRFAIRDGIIDKDSINIIGKGANQKLALYMQEKGLRPQQQLFHQFISQKILRATYTENQFREIMTDFWFNHFNVSISKNQCASYVPAFERDVIRPNVFGNFETFLVATAKSPAMLMYLDNFTSSGTNVAAEKSTEMMASGENNKARNGQLKKVKPSQKSPKGKVGGLNENYAREVMELHTLGVEGGYTQSDVTQAARILTGWTLAPMGENGYGAPMKKLLDRVGESNLRERGFVLDGDFLFAMNRHDNGEKTVLGKKFPAGGGYEEGLTLLKMLAENQSTAKFISKKLAVRFVSDVPPQSLINKMAKTFTSTKGDIKSVLMAMVSAPEFWTQEALREKTKSPFELAISAVRSLDAKVTQPYQLYTWINKMGQQMYYYQAPTGFPDRGQYWINTGSLLNRMNFGLALASKRIPGINFNLEEMNDNHEPESAEAALLIYSKLLMPERKLEETVARLKPMLNDPELQKNVAQAAERSTPPTLSKMVNEDADPMSGGSENVKPGKKALANNKTSMQNGANTMLAQVVGVIIGSPEFQRK